MKYALLCLLLVGTPLFATTIQVPADFGSIQAALDSSSEGDTVLVADGTYHENVHFPAHQVVLGSHFLIDGNAEHLDSTVISSPEFGVGHTVFFDSDQDTATVLVGFTIQNGEPGVRCISASPMIRNNIIRDNVILVDYHQQGCGIALDSSNAVIRENHIHHNYLLHPTALVIGGGIGARVSFPTIERNLIEFNGTNPEGINNIRGAGISIFYAGGQILDNHIRNNDAGGNQAGGIYCMGSSAFIRGNLIEYNTAWRGGGILLTNGDESILHENTIRYNEAFSSFESGSGRGGGIAVLSGEPTLGTPDHRLNVYENRSNQGYDFYKELYPETLALYADTVSISRADPRYYLDMSGLISVHSQTALYTQLPDHGTVYLSPDGDDENLGTSPESALRTFEVASRLIPYDGVQMDTIRLTEGTFQFDAETLPSPVLLDQKICITGSGPESTIIESSSIPVVRAEYYDSGVLRALSFHGVQKAVSIVGAQVTIDSVDFHDCRVAIEGDGASGSITHCLFAGSGSYRQSEGVVQLKDSGNLEIDHCSFVNNLSTPLVSNHDRALFVRRTIFLSNIGAIHGIDYTQLMMYNCLITDNSGNRPPLDFDSSQRSEINNCTVVDNQQTDGESAALYVGNVWAYTKVFNSIFWNNRVGEDDTQIVYTTEWDSMEVSYSDVEDGYPGAMNYQVDPDFDNVNTYQLASSSPLIDAGRFTNEFHDIEDPENPGFALYPSQGTFQNDLGIYGGPTPLQPEAIYTGVGDPESDVPAVVNGFELSEPCPNPFNSYTFIQLDLTQSVPVRAVVYDLLGREAMVLVNRSMSTGTYRLVMDAGHLASGVYLLRVSTPGKDQVRKLVLLK